MNHRERIGNRIAEIRKEKGLTQEQLSEITGLDRANIAKIDVHFYPNPFLQYLGQVAKKRRKRKLYIYF